MHATSRAVSRTYVTGHAPPVREVGPARRSCPPCSRLIKDQLTVAPTSRPTESRRKPRNQGRPQWPRSRAGRSRRDGRSSVFVGGRRRCDVLACRRRSHNRVKHGLPPIWDGGGHLRDPRTVEVKTRLADWFVRSRFTCTFRARESDASQLSLGPDRLWRYSTALAIRRRRRLFHFEVSRISREYIVQDRPGSHAPKPSCRRCRRRSSRLAGTVGCRVKDERRLDSSAVTPAARPKDRQLSILAASGSGSSCAKGIPSSRRRVRAETANPNSLFQCRGVVIQRIRPARRAGEGRTNLAAPSLSTAARLCRLPFHGLIPPPRTVRHAANVGLKGNYRARPLDLPPAPCPTASTPLAPRVLRLVRVNARSALYGVFCRPDCLSRHERYLGDGLRSSAVSLLVMTTSARRGPPRRSGPPPAGRELVDTSAALRRRGGIHYRGEGRMHPAIRIPVPAGPRPRRPSARATGLRFSRVRHDLDRPDFARQSARPRPDTPTPSRCRARSPAWVGDASSVLTSTL